MIQYVRKHILALGCGLLVIAVGIAVSWPGPIRHSVGGAVFSALPVPFKVAALLSLGRSECGWVDSFKAIAETAREQEIIGRLSQTSRVVRKEGDFELWDTEHGPFWIIAGSNMPLFYHMLAEQEIGVYEAPGVEVRPGDVVLDCGANYGVFTRAALSRGAALVIAIEPVPENAACLRRTFANEVAANRVVVVEAGVWDGRGTLTLQMDPRNSWCAHVVEARPEVGWLATQVSKQVRLVPIDDLTEDLRLPKVDFIKMDIEGSERRALDGAKKTIARWRPRMAICVYHRPDDLQEVSRRVPWWYLKLSGHCEDHGASIKREVLLFY